MKEVVVYESSDGIKFVHRKYCLEYESLLRQCNEIESLIPLPKNIIADSDYVAHKVDDVIKAKKMYRELAAKSVPDFMKWAEDNGHIINFRNESDLIVQREGFQCLARLAERFDRIDDEGREFKYRELTVHPKGLKGFRKIKTK